MYTFPICSSIYIQSIIFYPTFSNLLHAIVAQTFAESKMLHPHFIVESCTVKSKIYIFMYKILKWRRVVFILDLFEFYNYIESVITFYLQLWEWFLVGLTVSSQKLILFFNNFDKIAGKLDYIYATLL